MVELIYLAAAVVIASVRSSSAFCIATAAAVDECPIPSLIEVKFAVNEVKSFKAANIRFLLRGNEIEEVDQFKYLGGICSSDMSMWPEINARVSKAT